VFPLLERTLSRIGNMKEAPVEAEIRTGVSNEFHTGGHPKGPVTMAVNQIDPSSVVDIAFRRKRLVNPDYF
jgi:hypothetical protein